MFAIAARAACAQPAALPHISETLEMVTHALVAPELQTAEECTRLWQVFSRVAKVPKEFLRREAGRAFCRDLDALGQRLELVPLPEWMELPEALDEPQPLTKQNKAEQSWSLVETQAQARALAPKELSPQKILGFISRLEQQSLRMFLERLVGQGELSRSDVNLLVRQMVKGDAISTQDTMLIEVLKRLGQALVD